MEQNSGLLYLIKLIIQKKKQFITITILAVMVGIALAFLLPVYYKSTCIFYPFSPKAYDPRYMFSNGGNIELFGTGDDADRVITIGNSSLVTNYIIEKYNLIDRYKIDRDDKYFYIKATETFRKNYSISEDDRSAITVTIYDQNPDTAAIIANDIVAQIDFYNRKPLIESNIKQLDKFRSELLTKYTKLDSLSKLSGNTKQQMTDSQKDMVSIEMINTYSDMKEAETRLSILEQDFKTLYIIEKAAPIIKKAKPVRWIVVSVTTLGTLFLYLAGLVLMEQYQKNIKNDL
jgi:LPS O-antigen subunit length determinant protein (WzzB/FepE family)